MDRGDVHYPNIALCVEEGIITADELARKLRYQARNPLVRAMAARFGMTAIEMAYAGFEGMIAYLRAGFSTPDAGKYFSPGHVAEVIWDRFAIPLAQRPFYTRICIGLAKLAGVEPYLVLHHAFSEAELYVAHTTNAVGAVRRRMTELGIPFVEAHWATTGTEPCGQVDGTLGCGWEVAPLTKAA